MPQRDSHRGRRILVIRYITVNKLQKII
uniref:Uncharacterized protein n=1 Tax=Phlebotomus papatasi TaxID=29031 RepID=A0A1B0GPI6_PHLPP